MTNALRHIGGDFARLTTASLALGLVAACPTLAQDFEQIAPRPVEPAGSEATLEAQTPQLEGSDAVLLERLRGVVFIASPDAVVAEDQADLTGLHVEGLPLLETDDFEALVKPHLNQPASLRSLNELARDVVLYYRQHDRPVVDVYVPEQDITAGVVQFVVFEGRLGDVRVQGNKHFASGLFTSQVRSGAGETLSAAQVQADADWLNQNPFREVDVVFTPGSKPGTTDLELRVEDRFPLRLYTGYENTGTSLTDEDRLFAGVNWGNAFGLDHQLGYQFTTSPDLEKFTAHAATYHVPLPWRHTLSVFGSYAESDAAMVAPFDMNGQSWQAGLRYGIPFQSRSNRFNHELRLGLDFKQSNNNLLFGGAQVFDTTTDIAQFVLSYDAALADAWGATSLGLAAFLSPGDLTDRNRRDHFEQSRTGADPSYAYARLELERATRLPANFTWLIRGQAQLASDNLLASEQLGLGGYDTIRGYTHREANGDQGFWLSTELRTPPLQPARLLGIDTHDALQLLGFFDYGIVRPHDPLPGENRHTTLASTGVGLRYAVARVLNLRYDYGWQLRDSGVSPTGRNGQHHLGLTLSLNF